MRAFILFFCLVSLALPATITLTTNCNSSSEVLTATASCSLGAALNYVQANASAAVATSGNTLTLNVGTNVAASSTSGPVNYVPYYGTASVSVAASLSTSGPARLGYVEIKQFVNTQGAGSGGANLSYDLGSAISEACMVSTCISLRNEIWVPIELGTTVPLTLSQTANAASDPIQYQGYGEGTSSLSFSFFEADQLTPAALFDSTPTATPEPYSWALLALGLASVATLHRRRV